MVDVFDGIVLSSPEEQIVIDQTAAARYGLNADDIRATLESAIEGTVATQLSAGDRLLDVRVRYPTNFHHDLSALAEVQLQYVVGEHRAAGLGGRIAMGRRDAPRSPASACARSCTSRRVWRASTSARALSEIKAQLSKMVLPAGVSLELAGSTNSSSRRSISLRW